MKGKALYEAAGVNIDAGSQAASRYARWAEKTRRAGVLGGIGGFSGGFELDVAKYPQPVLVSGTDGVGTKIKVAFAAGKHDTVGIDCVAMSVNDILTCGAEPLYFLDYLAVHQLDVDVAEAIVSGVAKGCVDAGCALIGGETAEMSDLYSVGEYDLAGCAVGVVNKDAMIDGRTIGPGDVVIGIASNGLHSNGYSLVRKLVAEQRLAWTDPAPWTTDSTVADELLHPTRIYVKPIHGLLERRITLKGMAHITGGGIVENLPRCLPSHVSARISRGQWPTQPIFEWLQNCSGLSFDEAAAVWNLGIGYVLVVSQDDMTKTQLALAEMGEKAFVIGDIVSGDKTVRLEA